MTGVSGSEPTAQSGQLPGSVGVVGGGRMGSGIAHAFLTSGSSVAVVEADPAAGDRARAAIATAIQASADRGKLAEPVDDVLGRLRILAAAADLSDQQLVIEAVPETVELKTSVLGAIAEAVAADTVIATNTSSFSVTELAATVDRPGRFIGLHFFNPVPASKLIEIIVGTDTADTVVADAKAWAAVLGKTAVTVRDSPGFASSRLGVLLGLEAIRMVEEDVASPADIDAAMTLGYGHPMGPLHLTDLVGLDVRLGVADYLAGKLGDRFTAPQLLRDMVSRGELGRKSGRGFFDWSDS